MNGHKQYLFHLLILAALNQMIKGDEGDDKLLYEELQQIEKIKILHVYYLRLFITNNINRIDIVIADKPIVRDTLIEQVKEIEKWWLKDFATRIVASVQKLLKYRFASEQPFGSVNFIALRNELSKSLSNSNKYWADTVTSMISTTIKHPEIFKTYYFAPNNTTITTTPELKLSPEKQDVYDKQIQNLTRIQTGTELLVSISLINFQSNDCEKDEIQCSSDKIKVDRIRESNLHRGSKKMINDIKLQAIENVKAVWRNDTLTEHEISNKFNTIYKEYFANVTSVLKKIEESTTRNWSHYEYNGL